MASVLLMALGMQAAHRLNMFCLETSSTEDAVKVVARRGLVAQLKQAVGLLISNLGSGRDLR